MLSEDAEFLFLLCYEYFICRKHQTNKQFNKIQEKTYSKE